MTVTKITKAKAPAKVPALQVNAVAALHLEPKDLTADGLKTLQGGVVGASSRVALAVFVSPVTSAMTERALAEFLGVSKGTAGNIKHAGPILARCGAPAADPTVAKNVLALVAGKRTKALDGKSGAALVKAIGTEYADFRKSENAQPTRKAGKATAAEKAAAAKAKSERDAASVAKASNAQRIGGAVLFLSAVVKSGADDVTEDQVANLFAIVSELSALVADKPETKTA